MDLFAAAGIELGHGGRGGGRSGRLAARTLKVPLLNHRVVADALKILTFDPTPAQVKAAQNYAKVARSPKFAGHRETTVRNRFFEDVLGTILGYAQIDPDGPYTLAFEHPIRHGRVDVALGRFQQADGSSEIVAPFELKGPSSADLDLIPTGRGRSPVQQAWDYASDVPGVRWVLVSNCVEIRLYGFGRGRDAYELFDLRNLDDPEEHKRLWLVLSATRFLGGETDALLRATDGAYRTITTDLYVQYADLRGRLIAFLTGAADGPRLALAAAIEPAQKILDRILFIAFAQRTALLPGELLKRAAIASNEFNPVPIWNNFLGLFHAVDKGSSRLNVWPYNGGLFAPDAAVDSIALPDALVADLAQLGEWDYRHDVPITLLGHLFEQSITDLESLRAESRGEAPPKVSKRKKEGVVYTPDIVTRFLVERTVELTLRERFQALLAIHAEHDTLPTNGAPIAWRDGEESERAFWREYLAALRDLTIVDPACGSGAFLVAAFDSLAREYRAVLARLETLGEASEVDPFDEIVTKNLFGVDLNAESVEITRLALWLKTARSQHRLQNLDETIKVGNSLIDDKAHTDHPFDWRAAFPQVFARGGFDIVIGNPPYVRMEFIKAVKPYLEHHYVVAADRADLYAYFFERGVEILKPGGRLGYISSSTFFRTGSGENLRKFLGDRVAVESVVDFGDLQIFEGVTTYPAILTLRKVDTETGTLSFLKIDDELPKDLSAAFKESAQTMPRARLGAGSWRFEDDALARLRDKIVAGKKTLGEVYGPPLYGIKTGLNEAFIIDRATRDRLVKADPKSAELLKPFLRGENVKRWRVEPEDLFLINTPKGKVDIARYPAVRAWLLPFKKELEKRATKQEWFELQQAQLAYQPKLETDKIVYGHFAVDRIFTYDRHRFYSNDKTYFIPDAKLELLAYLNSSVAWLFIAGVSPAVRGGWHEMRVQYIEAVPIPHWKTKDRERLAVLGERCTAAAIKRFELESEIRRRLLDLTSRGGSAKLTRKLGSWWTLDFARLRAEVKRAFGDDIPLKERSEWETYLSENTKQVRALTDEIEKAEREIDKIVYRLFDLTADEIKLLEASLEGQY